MILGKPAQPSIHFLGAVIIHACRCFEAIGAIGSGNQLAPLIKLQSIKRHNICVLAVVLILHAFFAAKSHVVFILNFLTFFNKIQSK